MKKDYPNINVIIIQNLSTNIKYFDMLKNAYKKDTIVLLINNNSTYHQFEEMMECDAKIMLLKENKCIVLRSFNYERAKKNGQISSIL
jgi:hypothetical protein